MGGMGRRPFRRLVTALAVLALLLVGFAASSVAADGPCAMPMTKDASTPCDHDHDGGPDRSKQGADAALMCFAKCPLPVPDKAAGSVAGPILSGVPLLPVRSSVLSGIGVAPPLEPPRV